MEKEDEFVVLEGEVEKLGRVRKTWHNRWFVLTTKSLRYYDKKGGVRKGAMPIPPSTTVPVSGGDVPNCFIIVTPHRKMLVRTDDQDEMQMWRRELLRVAAGAARGQRTSVEYKRSQRASVIGADDLVSEDEGGGGSAGPAPVPRREVILKEGSLTKRGKWPHTWRQRYFRLVQRNTDVIVLEYSLGREGALKGFVYLAGASVMPVDASVRQHCFSIATSERELLIQARSDEEVDEWANAIQQAAIDAGGGFTRRRESQAPPASATAMAGGSGVQGVADAEAKGNQEWGGPSADGDEAARGGRPEALRDGGAGALKGVGAVEEIGEFSEDDGDDGVGADPAAGETGDAGAGAAAGNPGPAVPVSSGDGGAADAGDAEAAGNAGAAGVDPQDFRRAALIGPDALPGRDRSSGSIYAGMASTKAATRLLYAGAVFRKKMGSEAAFHGPRFLWVPPGSRELRWSKGMEPLPGKSKAIALKDVIEVRVGRPDKLGKKDQRNAEELDATCFTLVHEKAKHTLDVRAVTQAQRDEWVAAVTIMLSSGIDT